MRQEPGMMVRLNKRIMNSEGQRPKQKRIQPDSVRTEVMPDSKCQQKCTDVVFKPVINESPSVQVETPPKVCIKGNLKRARIRLSFLNLSAEIAKAGGPQKPLSSKPIYKTHL
jgi:hypothetical protein